MTDTPESPMQRYMCNCGLSFHEPEERTIHMGACQEMKPTEGAFSPPVDGLYEINSGGKREIVRFENGFSISEEAIREVSAFSAFPGHATHDSGFRFAFDSGWRQGSEWQFSQTQAELERLRHRIGYLESGDIHTCHDQCKRTACVLRREVARLQSQNERMRLGLQKNEKQTVDGPDAWSVASEILAEVGENK